uniref:PH domain-containing protein n=1 Tax=Globodera pallida TaxID=36090 RepID=A0A183CQ26_GLOPA
YTRQYLCHRCQQRFCKRCFGGQRKGGGHKLCLDCLRTSEGYRSFSEGIPPTAHGMTPQARRNLLQIPASSSGGTAEGSTIKASFVSFRGTSGGKQMQRFFVLRKNFCLYSYRTDKDNCALAMLPLSGCDIAIHQSEKFCLTIRHVHRVYWMTCFNESDHAEWMAALLLSANAKLPGERGEDSDDGATGAAEEGTTNDNNSNNNSNGTTTGDPKGTPPIGSTTHFSSRLKYPFSSSNPLISGLIRRSASMGDARPPATGGAAAGRNTAEANGEEAAAASQRF